MTQALLHPPLAVALLPQRTLTRDLLLIGSGSLVVALLAQISIPLPFTPVPITGQTLGVLLVGAALGSRLGFLTLLTYLIEGFIGLPVFAGGAAGITRLLGPTGGFLVAFPLAAALIGLLVERFGADRHPLKMAGSMALSTLVIYLLGSTWLGIWLQGAGQFTGLIDLLAKAVIPFLPGDVLKMFVAAALLPTVWRWLGRRKDP